MKTAKKLTRVIRILNLWLPVIIWSIVIFSFSSHPTLKTSQIHWQDFIVKKSAHIIEYFLLALFVYRALISSNVPKKKAGFLAILYIILYGATDEFHQSFTPGREPRVRDVIIDTSGAILAIIAVWKLIPHLSAKHRLLAEKLLEPYSVKE